MTRPRLSIILIVHKMMREARRTLLAFSTAYQTGVSEDSYEVIVVESGVQELSSDWVQSFGQNFHYHFHSTDSVSPVGAVNVGVRMTRGENIALVVDGARMPTPGLVARTLGALASSGSCFVGALSWHLGPDVQWKASMHGYDQTVEDDLLDSISWPEDGYRLFEISTIAPSSKCGFLNGLPTELSWVALPRDTMEHLGGYDEGFQSPGGGLVNHDFLRRLCSLQMLTPVMLLGEGVFHQFHGGAFTSSSGEKRARINSAFRAEYERLRGCKFKSESLPECLYFGSMPQQAKRFAGLEPR